jgi:hypothetical protein
MRPFGEDHELSKMQSWYRWTVPVAAGGECVAVVVLFNCRCKPACFVSTQNTVKPTEFGSGTTLQLTLKDSASAIFQLVTAEDCSLSVSRKRHNADHINA